MNVALLCFQEIDTSPANRRVYDWLCDKTRQIAPIPTELVNGILSDVVKATFHSVHYLEFPVRQKPPAAMANRNLFVVTSKGELLHFTSRARFAQMFKSRAVVVQKDKFKAIGLGYVQVSSTFGQDGYFRYLFDERRVSVRIYADSATVTAMAPVATGTGDTGSLTSTLTFEHSDNGYVLTAIKEYDTVRAGKRPS